MGAHRRDRGGFLRPLFQFLNLLIGLALLAVGLTEFFNEPPLFDILGDEGARPSLPTNTFNLVSDRQLLVSCSTCVVLV